MPKRGGSRGRKKPSLADLSREFLTTDDLVGYINEAAGTSDRSAALVGAAAIEQALVTLLETKFIDDPEVHSEKLRALHDPNAILSTFANKTILCYMLGLITKEQKDDLDVIRRIRNVFAHRVKPLRFTHPLIKEELDRLKMYPISHEDMSRTNIAFFASVQKIYRDLLNAATVIGNPGMKVTDLRAPWRP